MPVVTPPICPTCNKPGVPKISGEKTKKPNTVYFSCATCKTGKFCTFLGYEDDLEEQERATKKPKLNHPSAEETSISLLKEILKVVQRTEKLINESNTLVDDEGQNF